MGCDDMVDDTMQSHSLSEGSSRVTDPISQHPSFRHGSQDSTSHLSLGMFACMPTH